MVSTGSLVHDTAKVATAAAKRATGKQSTGLLAKVAGAGLGGALSAAGLVITAYKGTIDLTMWHGRTMHDYNARAKQATEQAVKANRYGPNAGTTYGWEKYMD